MRKRVVGGIVLAVLLGGCGSGDSGSSGPPAATVPTPTPTSTPAPTPTPTATPTPVPDSTAAFPLNGSEQFATTSAVLSYDGAFGQVAVSNTTIDRGLVDNRIRLDTDQKLGLLQIDELGNNVATFSASMPAQPPAIALVDLQYPATTGGGVLTVLNNFLPGGVVTSDAQYRLKYSSYASWKRTLSTPTRTRTSWHVFGFKTDGAALPRGVRRYRLVAKGDYVAIPTGREAEEGRLSATGTAVVDFDARTVSFEQVTLYISIQGQGDRPLALNGAATIDTGAGRFGGTVYTGSTVETSFLTGNITGLFFGPGAEEIGMSVDVRTPTRSDITADGKGVMVLAGRLESDLTR